MIINGKEFPQKSLRIRNTEKADRNIRRIIVHSGKFHADDVFAAAILLMIWPDAEVERKGAVEKGEYDHDAETIVTDIGHGKFDHHQPDAEIRENGNRYAACGLVFREFGELLFEGNAEAADTFEKEYIYPIEITDNGGVSNPLSRFISSLNPSWDCGKNSDERFAEAVAFAQTVIFREIERAESEERALAIVREALDASDGIVVVLPRELPWQETLSSTNAVYAVFPANRGGISLRAVPLRKGDRTPKKPLPKQWLTQKPEGCVFVHPALFAASFLTEEAAVSAARKALVM